MKLKLLAALLITTFSVLSIAGTKVKTPITCTGEAETEGLILMKRVLIELKLNSFPEPYPTLGHVAKLNGKSYIHAGDVSFCEKIGNSFIHCRGQGLGNGPDLNVTIDMKTMEASGTYKNPEARRNSSATYRFERLSCAK